MWSKPHQGERSEECKAFWEMESSSPSEVEDRHLALKGRGLSPLLWSGKSSGGDDWLAGLHSQSAAQAVRRLFLPFVVGPLDLICS